MSGAARAMRKRCSQLLAALDAPGSDADLLRAVRAAIEQVRGRPVRLRAVTFPPEVASGLWIDRTSHDVIAYEEQTDLDHQLVIIGHEVWHMLEGHCGSLTGHGAATRSQQDRAGLHAVVAAISEADAAELPPMEHMDAELHIALRADDPSVIHQEGEAEFFGYKFATGVRDEVAVARSLADPEHLAGRIQLSMGMRRF
ncbi:toxin-antitoxin system, toxin component [Streptomyces sp. NPDC005732]|uniref:toxin-antitoxin system, toxin component n=1 Tax=Streptomyces sp. NPDC005732 TaxID=3157057 RepID=UPI0033E48431